MDHFVIVLWLLVLWHYLADYPLQGPFLSAAKDLTKPIPGFPWWQAMAAHSFIHSGGVLLITGSIYFALVEFILHFVTDTMKCLGKISLNADQALHLGLKCIYVLIIMVHS